MYFAACSDRKYSITFNSIDERCEMWKCLSFPIGLAFSSLSPLWSPPFFLSHSTTLFFFSFFFLFFNLQLLSSSFFFFNLFFLLLPLIPYLPCTQLSLSRQSPTPSFLPHSLTHSVSLLAWLHRSFSKPLTDFPFLLHSPPHSDLLPHVVVAPRSFHHTSTPSKSTSTRQHGKLQHPLHLPLHSRPSSKQQQHNHYQRRQGIYPACHKESPPPHLQRPFLSNAPQGDRPKALSLRQSTLLQPSLSTQPPHHLHLNHLLHSPLSRFLPDRFISFLNNLFLSLPHNFAYLHNDPGDPKAILSTAPPKALSVCIVHSAETATAATTIPQPAPLQLQLQPAAGQAA